MLFDTHAHLDDTKFDEDRDEVIERAKQGGVEYILTVSANVASSIENISLAQNYDIFYASIGIHPHEVADLNSNVISALTDFSTYPKVVAIGEIGLDYFYENSPREAQKIWFARQISLARSVRLPIIVHSRDAQEDTLNILRSERADEVGGVMHCFSGSVETARELLNMGFMISFAGPITFKNAKRLPEVIKYVPEDMILIETDCPYLAPEPYRGKRNEPANVRLIAERIAEIKGKPFDYIAEKTTANAKRLFNIQ